MRRRHACMSALALFSMPALALTSLHGPDLPIVTRHTLCFNARADLIRLRGSADTLGALSSASADLIRLRGGADKIDTLVGSTRARMPDIFGWYARFSLDRPFMSNLATMGLFAVMGDVVMQHLEGNGDAYDFERTARFALFRVGYSAPFYTVWYALLARVVPPVPVARAAVLKAALDNAVATPAQHVALFACQAAWEGQAHEAVARCMGTLPRSLPASWAFWVPVQLVTFGVVPAEFRVAWINTVSLGWNAILSGFNQRARYASASE